MPITVALPVVSPVPDDTIIGQKVIFAHLPDGGAQKNFRAKVASISRALSKISRKVPDTDGSLIADRQVVTEKTVTIKLTMDEFSADLVTTFLNVAQSSGKGRMWIGDPDDAANTVALLSNEFNCAVTLEGDVSFQQDQFSECQLTVEVTGAFTLTRDGSTTV